MRVGRGPLDEEAITLLEAGHPDLEFDWTHILKGQPALEASKAEPRPDRERARERDRKAPPPPRRERVEPARSADPPIESPIRPPVEEPTSAAHARLGSEGLARLRARYSEMLARISERTDDPNRQGELKSLAERLNPDGWVTGDDVTAGLESYEATFAALRAELAPPRPAPPPAGSGEGDHSV